MDIVESDFHCSRIPLHFGVTKTEEKIEFIAFVESDETSFCYELLGNYLLNDVLSNKYNIVVFINHELLPILFFTLDTAITEMKKHYDFEFDTGSFDYDIAISKLVYFERCNDLDMFYNEEFDFFEKPEFCMTAFEQNPEAEKYFNL